MWQPDSPDGQGTVVRSAQWWKVGPTGFGNGRLGIDVPETLARKELETTVSRQAELGHIRSGRIPALWRGQCRLADIGVDRPSFRSSFRGRLRQLG
jgi:hypothetical protein